MTRCLSQAQIRRRHDAAKARAGSGMFGIDARSPLALPCCDAVRPASARANTLTAVRLGQRTGTVVLRKVTDLPMQSVIGYAQSATPGRDFLLTDRGRNG
jgi:hypothetical protein